MSEPIDVPLQQRWHPFVRTAFRFAFVYLLLYNLPFPLTAIPYVDKAAELYNSIWTWIVPRLAQAVFNKEVDTVINGSGDRAFDYLLVACLLLISLVIAVIWSFASKVENHCWIRVSTTCGSGWVNRRHSESIGISHAHHRPTRYRAGTESDPSTFVTF